MLRSTEKHGVLRARRRRLDGAVELGSVERVALGRVIVHMIDPDGIDTALERGSRPRLESYLSMRAAVGAGWVLE